MLINQPLIAQACLFRSQNYQPTQPSINIHLPANLLSYLTYQPTNLQTSNLLTNLLTNLTTYLPKTPSAHLTYLYTKGSLPM